MTVSRNRGIVHAGFDHGRPRDWQTYSKCRPPLLAFALHVHAAVMQLNQMTHNRQTQTETALRTRRRAIGLPEAIENVGNKFGRNANAGISHGNTELPIPIL